MIGFQVTVQSKMSGMFLGHSVDYRIPCMKYDLQRMMCNYYLHTIKTILKENYRTFRRRVKKCWI